MHVRFFFSCFIFHLLSSLPPLPPSSSVLVPWLVSVSISASFSSQLPCVWSSSFARLPFRARFTFRKGRDGGMASTRQVGAARFVQSLWPVIICLLLFHPFRFLPFTLSVMTARAYVFFSKASKQVALFFFKQRKQHSPPPRCCSAFSSLTQCTICRKYE